MIAPGMMVSERVNWWWYSQSALQIAGIAEGIRSEARGHVVLLASIVVPMPETVDYLRLPACCEQQVEGSWVDLLGASGGLLLHFSSNSSHQLCISSWHFCDIFRLEACRMWYWKAVKCGVEKLLLSFPYIVQSVHDDHHLSLVSFFNSVIKHF